MKKYIFITIIGLSLTLGGVAFAADLNLDAYGTFSNVEIVQKTIYLHKGWNLAQGFAGTEWITGGVDLEKNNIKAIFALNPLNKKYVRFYPDPEKNNISDLRSITQLAYWVYSDKDGTIDYKMAKQDTLKFTWPAGWNIISIAPEFIGKSLDDVKGNCVIEKIYWWSPREQQYIDVLKDFSKVTVSDNNIGTGLVLKLLSGCNLGVSKNNNITPPPQLPN